MAVIDSVQLTSTADNYSFFGDIEGVLLSHCLSHTHTHTPHTYKVVLSSGFHDSKIQFFVICYDESKIFMPLKVHYT